MIGIRCNCTALQYKRLSGAMSRVADSHPEKTGFKTALSIFFFFFFLGGGGVHFYGSTTPPTYCIVTVKGLVHCFSTFTDITENNWYCFNL